VQDNDGRTPLHYAVENYHVDVARVLLDHGVDPTIRNNEGRTPLDYGSNCEEFIEELRHRSTGTTVYE
jgi:ankyrin repeat protein